MATETQLARNGKLSGQTVGDYNQVQNAKRN